MNRDRNIVTVIDSILLVVPKSESILRRSLKWARDCKRWEDLEYCLRFLTPAGDDAPEWVKRVRNIGDVDSKGNSSLGPSA